MEKKYFNGNEISSYGLQNGYVDYHAFAKSFDAVLCNNITSIDESVWNNMENYFDDEESESYVDVFQWYIVSDNAEYLLREAGEVLSYSDKLDCYIWGVTHFGTSWDYVLTDIKIDW